MTDYATSTWPVHTHPQAFRRRRERHRVVGALPACARMARSLRWLSRAAAGAALMAAAGAAGAATRYNATWASLDTRPNPPWYDEAKVGIFIVGGVFSVPSWGLSKGGASGEWFEEEWQGSNGNKGDPAYAAFVAERYPPTWTYADFAPSLTYDLFNATAWAELFVESGAKYTVFLTKHHDGECQRRGARWWSHPQLVHSARARAALSPSVVAPPTRTQCARAAPSPGTTSCRLASPTLRLGIHTRLFLSTRPTPLLFFLLPALQASPCGPRQRRPTGTASTWGRAAT